MKKTEQHAASCWADMDHRVLIVTDNLFCVLSVMPDDIRLVGGASRCAGRLEMRKQGNWTPVDLKRAAAVLVNGTDLCSGRLEVRSNLSWSSVCEDDFDQQDAEVVCRELSCGAPSVFQGALYGEGAPVWTEEFQCAGNESVLLDCRRSGSATKTCSPDKAVGLTCSDPHDVRLVGEASRCAGELEMKIQGEWRPVADWESEWDQISAATVCRQLDCGSAVCGEVTDIHPDRPVWWVKSSCVESASALSDCVMITGPIETYAGLEVICSGIIGQSHLKGIVQVI
uniref:SRCR domain-containing protein n=1 Tax=Seriola dumerili TaxID=41447 RepID=A0A3B4TJJ5_SERDU